MAKNREQIIEGALEEKDAMAGASKGMFRIPEKAAHIIGFKIRGSMGSPLCMHAFGAKARRMMHEVHLKGDSAEKKRKEPRDFNKDYEEAIHYSTAGWIGIPCAAFRNAMIRAATVAEMKMVLTKLLIFVEPDGVDKNEHVGLVKITKGTPHYDERPATISGGKTDLRVRPMWDEWEAIVRVRYDSKYIGPQDVANLMARAGDVGVLEGRNGSKMSAGLGWGSFDIILDAPRKKK